MRRLTVSADWLLLVYALVVGWLCLYVPWGRRGRYGYVGEDLGYWFVWNPPKSLGASIDLTRVMLEVVAATAALVVLAMGRDWWSRRRLQSKPTSARDALWIRWGPVELTPLGIVIVVGLGLAVLVLILTGLASLFSGGR